MVELLQNTSSSKKVQGDPISGFLYILVLEIAFLKIKKNWSINGINIFSKTFLYSAYADDTIIFVGEENSVKEAMNTFDKFTLLSCLKLNKEKC